MTADPGRRGLALVLLLSALAAAAAIYLPALAFRPFGMISGRSRRRCNTVFAS